MHLLNKCETVNKSRKREYGRVQTTVFSPFFCISVIFFAKAKSDIIAVAIVILKPYGFSDILFASQTRVANITRRKPITAKQ